MNHRRWTLAVPVLCALGVGPTMAADENPAGTQVSTTWPENVAGKSRLIVTDLYAVYADEAQTVEGLGAWLDAKLTILACISDCPTIRPGIVVLIEKKDDLPPNVEKWRRENVSRRRRIAWTSPIRQQSLRTSNGRPYSFFYSPYFVEGFAMPVQDAQRIGLLDNHPSPAAWVCFLPTDAYVKSAFNEKLSRHRKANIAAMKERGEKSTASDLFVWFLFTTTAEVLYPRYGAIDIELVGLQRREALWRAALDSCALDKERRQELIRKIQADIDEEWKRIWLRQPIE